jgi:kynurenine formamidase
VVFYNGFRAGEHILGPTDARDAGMATAEVARSTSAAHALGIERMAETCVQGRGVMIDLRAHFGDARTAVGYDALMRIMEQDKVEVQAGDLVCLHTGFAQLLLDMGGKPDVKRLMAACAGLDGRDAKLLQWITDSGIVALIADNQAVEVFPAPAGKGCCASLPLHEHCLFKQGIYLGELWYLTALADWLCAHGRNRFLLTAPPLRLPGAVGSPVTPVATV